jgi:hypothetical protein
MVQVTQIDARRATELVKFLGRAKMELEGAEEMLAAGQVLHWFGEHAKKIHADVAQQEAAAAEEIQQALAFKRSAGETKGQCAKVDVEPKAKGKK